MTSTATTAPCGHHTTEPAQLCNPCTTHLHQRLTRMQPLYAALSGFLAPTGRRPEYGTAPATEAPLPVRTEVLDLRGPGGIVGILEDWRAAAHAARGFTPPDAAGLIPTRIEAAACALQANMSWISLTWDMGPAMATEIRSLEQRALAVISPPDRTIPLGPCPADSGDGTPCGTILRVPAGTTDVRCRGCGRVWPPSLWLPMRRWMDYDRAQAEEAEAA
jgi:hypothetical protein